MNPFSNRNLFSSLRIKSPPEEAFLDMVSGLQNEGDSVDPLTVDLEPNKIKNPNKQSAASSSSSIKSNTAGQETFKRDQLMRKIFSTPEEILGRADSVRSIPEYADSVEAQQENERMMKTLANMELPESFGGAKQLLALADSETGSKLLGGYSQPDAMDDYVKTMTAYQQAQNKQKQEKYSELLKAAGGVDAGYETGTAGTKETLTDTSGEKGEEQKKDEVVPIRAAGSGKQKDPIMLQEFNKGVGKWMAENASAGKQQNSMSAITLEKIADGLKNGKYETGTKWVIGSSAADKLRYTHPALKAAIDDINKISAQSIKSMLPGSVSNMELNFIKSLAFDPILPSSVNEEKLRKAVRILRKIDKNQDAVMDHALANNYNMRGFGWPMKPEESIVAESDLESAPVKSESKKQAPAADAKKPLSFEEWKAKKAKK